MPTALIAPDSFKGTLTASEVTEALAAGAEDGGWDVDPCPLADGGEGTAAVLLSARGGTRIPETATDPLGRSIEASWALLADGQTAVVEVAEVSGIALLSREERDPLEASSFGTGELIAAAASRAATVLVALGGSATVDGGRGAIEAVEAMGGIGSARLVCLCDVRTRWESASATFATQKGAGPAEVDELARRLEAYAGELPRDPRGLPGAGAAGGLGGGLWAAFGAELCSGAAYVCDAIGIDGRIAAAELVIGGEGRLDGTTLEGKAMAELARRCVAQRKPLVLVVGRDDSTPAIRTVLRPGAVLEAGDVVALRAASALAVRGVA